MDWSQDELYQSFHSFCVQDGSVPEFTVCAEEVGCDVAVAPGFWDVSVPLRMLAITRMRSDFSCGGNTLTTRLMVCLASSEIFGKVLATGGGSVRVSASGGALSAGTRPGFTGRAGGGAEVPLRFPTETGL